MAKAQPDKQRKAADRSGGFVSRVLNGIEAAGNRLPDPAMLFLLLLLLTWVASALLAPIEFAESDPRTGEPLRIANPVDGRRADHLPWCNWCPPSLDSRRWAWCWWRCSASGVAEKTGFINAGLKLLLGFTSRSLLTPMLILAAIVSHSAADAGYVLVIPLGGVIFYAAGRHPLAGISGRLRRGLRAGSRPTSFLRASTRYCRASPSRPPRFSIPTAWSTR